MLHFGITVLVSIFWGLIWIYEIASSSRNSKLYWIENVLKTRLEFLAYWVVPKGSLEDYLKDNLSGGALKERGEPISFI